MPEAIKERKLATVDWSAGRKRPERCCENEALLPCTLLVLAVLGVRLAS